MKTSSTTVRLVTGDRVTVTTLSDGHRTVSVKPGPGREHLPFQTVEGDDKALSVLPFDAQPLVTAGTLDRRLFDVSALIAAGYDEAHTSALPLIVSSLPEPPRPGARISSQAARMAGETADRLVAYNDSATPSRDLPSIRARSLRVTGSHLGAFWKTLNPGGKSDAARAAVMPRVSLDGRLKAVLDRSTAQINAPVAWKAGYEGQGVKVAILDTGADLQHPDLAGRVAAAQDFSHSGNTGDHFGHGTHVASIVSGTGAASGGSRRGVAPKADLLIGKVLGDDGYGSESDIIDGMEWAVGQHAKVVNMSLSSPEQTDGTDPLSQAVNSITESTGTLFVVAAGNAGPSPSTVGAPGAAEAALTVGAVDRDDSLAPFSSRGPRYGDSAVKPDVTAPGVGIVAARASGTALGDPVDANYTSMSGTSMATPHVAGAAALLAQEHPDWKAQQLKDALVSTAHRVAGTKVTEQGGGRIDLAAAMGPVIATGSVTLDPLYPDSNGRQTRTVRYTNTTDHALSLDLDLVLTTESGRKLADGVVALGSRTVQLAAGATADVPLQNGTVRAERGRYYGYVTATAADGTVLEHTTVALVVHAPQHQLKLVYRDREGKVVPGWLPVIWGPDGYVDYTDRDAGVAVVEEGTYYASSSFADTAADGYTEQGNLVAPEVKVTKDTTVTLNAAEATEVKVSTPRQSERFGLFCPTYYRQVDGEVLIQSTVVQGGDRFYTTPTDRVTDGAFEVSLRGQMMAPQLQAKTDGSSKPFRPYYETYSPVFGDGGARLTAAPAGTAQAPDFRGTRGKLAVLRDDSSAGYDNRALAQAAKSAGAKALLLVMPDHFPMWTEWRPTNDRLALPYVRSSPADGSALLKQMSKGSTSVDFTGTVRSPYIYDVMAVWKDFIPKSTVHVVTEKNSAVVNATYRRTGDSEWSTEQRFAWRPYQSTVWGQSSRFVPVGRDRVEYVSADAETRWQHAVQYKVVESGDLPLQGGMYDNTHLYKPGQRATEQWFRSAVRPSIPRGAPTSSVRSGDTLAVYIPEFNDSASEHWSFGQSGDFGGVSDTAVADLYRNGEHFARSEAGAWGNFKVPAGAADYRLDLKTTRTSPDWHFAPSTQTSWKFRSNTAVGSTPLPLLQLDYDIPVDLQNAVSSAGRHTVGVTVRMQDGMAAPRWVRLKVETSYNDGRTWSQARTTHRATGGRFTAQVERPAKVHGDAYVTLRVTATDVSGNSVQQTVKRAYLHRRPR